MNTPHPKPRSKWYIVLSIGLASVATVLYLCSEHDPGTVRQATGQITSPEKRSIADATVSAIEPAKPTFIYVSTRSAGARVRVDGEWIGTTPLDPVEVEPGRHVIEVHLNGKRNRRVINLSAGRRKLVKFGL